MSSSGGSVWLVSGKWDSVMTFPGGGLTYFVDGMLCMEIWGQQAVMFQGLESTKDGMLPSNDRLAT
jgi:hypothetical protein